MQLGGKRKSTVERKFFLTLCCLQKNLSERDLAYRLKTSASNVSTVLSNQTPFLASEFQGLNNWPSQENVTKFYPKAFKLLTRVCSIINCTKRYVHKSSMAEAQTLTYSSYKSHDSSKHLVRLYTCKLCLLVRLTIVSMYRISF